MVRPEEEERKTTHHMVRLRGLGIQIQGSVTEQGESYRKDEKKT